MTLHLQFAGQGLVLLTEGKHASSWPGSVGPGAAGAAALNAVSSWRGGSVPSLGTRLPSFGSWRVCALGTWIWLTFAWGKRERTFLGVVFSFTSKTRSFVTRNPPSLFLPPYRKCRTFFFSELTCISSMCGSPRVFLGHFGFSGIAYMMLGLPNLDGPIPTASLEVTLWNGNRLALSESVYTLHLHG